MESADIRVMGFVWDEWNRAKIAAHGLTIDDIESVRRGSPKFFVNRPVRSAAYAMLGPDTEGRFIYVAIARNQFLDSWYVITAYRMERRRALRIYERG